MRMVEGGQADLVIGADGLRSTARQLFGDGPPRYAGYGAWLGLAEIEHPELKGEFGCEIYGAGERFGVIDTGRGKYYWYFVGSRRVASASRRNFWEHQSSLRSCVVTRCRAAFVLYVACKTRDCVL